MIWLALPGAGGGRLLLLAIVAAWRWPTGTRAAAAPASRSRPSPFSSPFTAAIPGFYEAIRSHARQDYPEFEILFGVSDPADPALDDIDRLQREFPRVADPRVAWSPTDAPNAKVGVLAELARHARHPLLLVNDSDIVVEPGLPARRHRAARATPASAW